MKAKIVTVLFGLSISTMANTNIKSITLEDSGAVIPAKDIHAIWLKDNKHIDLVELNNGEIFYDTELSKVEYQNHTKAIGSWLEGGGDGSGGGFRVKMLHTGIEGGGFSVNSSVFDGEGNGGGGMGGGGKPMR